MARVERGAKISKTCKVGCYTFIAKNSHIEKNTKEIGNFCSIASGAVIGPNNHPLNMTSTSAVFYSSSWGIIPKEFDLRDTFNSGKETILESDVWVGANAIIMGGVKIGTGAVVGAGAVVTKSIPAYAIAVGVPAKIIGYRFESNVRENLLLSKWWCVTENNLDLQELERINNIVKELEGE